LSEEDVREIVIHAGDVAIRARLYDTPTADEIWRSLPIHGSARTWGPEVYFHTSVQAVAEPEARDVVSPGEIVFWPQGDAIAIAFGPTPLSRNGELRLAAPCNIWAIALDDVSRLRGVHAGEAICVSAAP
jgi:hypothetical protein